MHNVKSREQIVEAIKRTASENDGLPLGVVRFEQEMGIRLAEWAG
jgi:hypothetical protein